MRKPQRNWMLEEDGSWEGSACSLDWDMNNIWGHIAHNPDLAHVKDLLNNDQVLRSLMILVHDNRLKEIERLRKENSSRLKENERLWNKTLAQS